MEMDLGTFRGIGSLVLMLAYIGFCVWAYSPGQRARFDEAARLPLLGDDDETVADTKGGSSHV
jgi:cytochrome c oxidase cbb3-type subunit 4